MLLSFMLRYPATLILMALALGIGVAAHIDAAPLVLAGAATALALAASVARPTSPARTAILLAAVVTLGVLRGGSVPTFPEWLLLRAPRITEVTGSVVSYPSLGVDRIRFAIQPDRLPGRILVTWECPGAPAGTVHHGDRIHVVGRTERPGTFNDFDYAEYLARQGIFATMSADVAGLSPLGERASVFRTGDRIRQALLGSLQSRLTLDEFALAQSYVFGDRFALSDETEEAFARTGLMHILAVSGMHLTILLAGAWWVLRALRVRPVAAYPILALAVLVAVWVIGPWISFVRSALLFALFALGAVFADLGLVLRGSVRPMNALAAAALALLVAQPTALFDIGFQLSVAATAGLIAFAPRIRSSTPRVDAAPRADEPSPEPPQRKHRLRRAAATLFLVSLAAQAGASPILALQFGKLQVWTAVTGLVAIPVSSLALWLGVIALVASPLGSIADVAAAVFGWSLRAFESIVLAASNLPWTSLPTDPRVGIWIGGLVLLLAAARWVLSAPEQDREGLRLSQWRCARPSRTMDGRG